MAIQLNIHALLGFLASEEQSQLRVVGFLVCNGDCLCLCIKLGDSDNVDKTGNLIVGVLRIWKVLLLDVMF